eukprot:957102-Amorphochlora_amoeboformis.AAC.1
MYERLVTRQRLERGWRRRGRVWSWRRLAKGKAGCDRPWRAGSSLFIPVGCSIPGIGRGFGISWRFGGFGGWKN